MSDGVEQGSEQGRPGLWRVRAAALAGAGAAAGLTVMLLSHRSQQPAIGPWSIAAAAALLLAAAAAAGCLAVALLPSRRLARLSAAVADQMQSLTAGPEPGGRLGCGLVLAALAAVSFGLLAWHYSRLNTAPRHDQLAYLEEAAAVRQMGGPAELWRRLWAGTWRPANRHPLYLAILSWQPQFQAAKLLSVALAALLVGYVWLSLLHEWGWLAAGVTAVLLGTNSVLLASASLISCEALLGLLAWVVWLSAWSARWRPRWGCAAAGATLGLAYLTKATGVLLLLGLVAWSCLRPQLRRYCWLAPLAFALVAWPLLVRNWRVYGNPLYSYNTRFLFADSYDQGATRPYEGAWSAALRYGRTHSAGAVARRALTGLGWELHILLRCLAPAGLGPGRTLVGLVVLGLALIGAAASEWSMNLLAAIWCGSLVLVFAWYVPIAAGDRFLMPVVPLLLALAGRGTAVLAGSYAGGDGRRAGRYCLAASVMWCLTALALAFRAVS